MYLGGYDYDIGHIIDPITYNQTISNPFSYKWLKAIEHKMTSMVHNNVSELVEPPKRVKPTNCKCVFKTKKDSKGHVGREKTRLVAKSFIQKEGINYNETFSPVFSKNSFKIIMALVAHFDLEFYQIDVKTSFLNDNLQEEMYM